MPPAHRLSGPDREFFSLVARAVFTNPFSDERAEIDAKICGCSPRLHYHERRARTFQRVQERMDGLVAEGLASLDRYSGPDRETMSFAFLFDIYHRFKEDFDQLIQQQIQAGDTPCPVPFARQVLSALQERGFPETDALRNFALFYQIRRAFYFIHRSLVGESQCMKELRLNLWNNVFTSNIRWYNIYLWNRMEDFSTLLLGETGTGKGSAAAAIGRSGFIPFDEKRGCFRESFTRTFVSLNLSEFPETLIESELFGHKKGAFTGAVEDHQGIFAVCAPFGSIFLDEIGEVSSPVQIKLLHVLQERNFCPVGSHEKKRFRGRVIAATNRPLKELRRGGLFRDDFYYRLCSDVIVVPPLRQRVAEDSAELELLVRHTLERTLGEHTPELADMVLGTVRNDLGLQYPWPGNVRELEQCVRRILLKRRYEGDLQAASGDLRSTLMERLDSEALDANSLVEAYCALLYRRHASYEQVARITSLDRRTVKKYVLRWEESKGSDSPAER